MGFYLCENQILNFGMINRALVVQFYFGLGFAYKNMENIKIINKSVLTSILLLVYIVLVILSFYIFPNEFVDVHLNHYFWLPYSIILILTGNIGLMMLAEKTKKYPRVLLLIGKNSLVIYLLHSWSFVFYDKIMVVHLGPFWLEAAFRTIFALVFCCLIAEFLNRRFPVVVGLKK